MENLTPYDALELLCKKYGTDVVAVKFASLLDYFANNNYGNVTRQKSLRKASTALKGVSK